MAEQVLTGEQLGHLRHFDNLSRRPRNDWSLMQSKAVGQDDFGGYRFQLAYMIYALALTHRHRLPAAPGLFQPTIQRLIDKLLEPEVWMYWRDTSRGGAPLNAHLTDQLKEEWDPVARDNIMYSAYVQSVALLHDYLFDSDRYARPDSLTFQHWSFFWGGEEKRFGYDRESLNDLVYWQMVQNGYMGVACEPNCVFQICNQPAILGFRLHDLITGGDRAAEVVAGYEKAWSEFGRLDETGHYNMMVVEDSRMIVPNGERQPWVDAWCGALMNMWNRDFVRGNYPRQVTDFVVPGPDGTLTVASPERDMPVPYDWCDLGWTTAWVSEMGDVERLSGLLAYADRYLSPTWADGGLYYPRNDTRSDDEGNLREVEPMTGNVLFGYARLNVPDGLWGLYNEPWDAAHRDAPALVAVDRDIEVSQAQVVDGALVSTLRRLPGDTGGGTVTVGRVVGRGRWRLSLDGDDRAELDGGEIRSLGAGAPAQVVGDTLVLRCDSESSTTWVLTPLG
ncbi:hypothetical protein [Pseudonocardia spinosispora]|uniref:linalool dehydratase/isomerase domain-containing protein n=1 Tax=Pseudonocardia spinosispora TaxID=103441 RepID=UPI0004042B16|nr:hypothetical protein [Pseudonocardia spinosispora]